MRKQRFTYKQMNEVVDYLAASSRGEANVAEQAMRDINYTEEQIRQGVESISHRSQNILNGLDRGLNLNELGEYQSAPASVDMLLSRRHHAYQTLALILDADQLQRLLSQDAS